MHQFSSQYDAYGGQRVSIYKFLSLNDAFLPGLSDYGKLYIDKFHK